VVCLLPTTRQFARSQTTRQFARSHTTRQLARLQISWLELIQTHLLALYFILWSVSCVKIVFDCGWRLARQFDRWIDWQRALIVSKSLRASSTAELWGNSINNARCLSENIRALFLFPVIDQVQRGDDTLPYEDVVFIISWPP